MEKKVIRMKKILLLIPLFALLLAAPAACAGHFNMNVKGSGNIGFYFISSDASGTIIQGYYGDGTIDYQSTYTDGTLETEIKSTGRGMFGTILFPANSWSAEETYSKDDGPSTYVFDSGTTAHIVPPHFWTSSFSNIGSYTIN